MTNVRKLMARLNASTCRFDIGRGGIPELTPQDIAGALGMVQDELAREVFCAVWWPDGSRLAANELLRLIGLRQRAEIDRQWRAVQVARLELHIARDDAAARGCLTDFDRRIIASLEQRLTAAKAQCWPCEPTVYPLIRKAVLKELCSPALCQHCGGRGEYTAGELKAKCRQCDGSGKQAVSNRRRAAELDRTEAAYRQAWCKPYEWTYELLADAEHRAARAMVSQLRSVA